MRALPCGSCFLRLRMPRSPSRHPLAGAAEQPRRDGAFAIATSSPSPFRAPSRLRCTFPSRVRCVGAARVARRRNSSLHDGSAMSARADRPRARFRCRRASRPNTHRIASHRQIRRLRGKFHRRTPPGGSATHCAFGPLRPPCIRRSGPAGAASRTSQCVRQSPK